MSQQDSLNTDLTIDRVRLIRWENGEPEQWDRDHPEQHPACLEVRYVERDGTKTTTYQRPDSCH